MLYVLGLSNWIICWMDVVRKCVRVRVYAFLTICYYTFGYTAMHSAATLYGPLYACVCVCLFVAMRSIWLLFNAMGMWVIAMWVFWIYMYTPSLTRSHTHTHTSDSSTVKATIHLLYMSLDYFTMLLLSFAFAFTIVSLPFCFCWYWNRIFIYNAS